MKSDFFRSCLFKNDLAAAPMAGISHPPFRRVLRRYFNGLIYSEMMSVEGVSRRNAESMEYLDRADGEYPLVFQFFGGRPLSFAEAVRVAEGSAAVDAFDINMGCPVKKVLKAGGGCSLLEDLPRLKEIVKAVRGATEKPFSIKIRVGVVPSRPVYGDILDIAEGEGADAVIIHARTKADMFGGTVRLDVLEDAASRCGLPVIGNGGVVSAETYKAMKSTGVAGVMIGRAMMKAPWIFEAVRKGADPDGYLSPAERLELLKTLGAYMDEHAAMRPEKRLHYMHVLRKFAVWFSKGMDEAASFRARVYMTQDGERVLRIIEDFFASA